MIFIFLLMFFGGPNGQTLTMDDFHARLSSMETKIEDLESEIKTLKSQDKDQDLETKIELKEVQADVSYILMEQIKMSDRNSAIFVIDHIIWSIKCIP